MKSKKRGRKERTYRQLPKKHLCVLLCAAHSMVSRLSSHPADCSGGAGGGCGRPTTFWRNGIEPRSDSGEKERTASVSVSMGITSVGSGSGSETGVRLCRDYNAHARRQYRGP